MNNLFYYSHWLILPFFSALMGGALALYAFRRRKEVAAARRIYPVMFAMGGWALAYALQVAAIPLPLKVFFFKVGSTFAFFTGPTALALAFELSGYGHWITRRRAVLVLALPAIALLSSWTAELHQLNRYSLEVVRSGPLLVLEYEEGPLYKVQLLSALALNLASQVVFLVGLLRSPAGSRFRYFLLLLGAVVPLAAELLDLTPHRGFFIVTSTLWVTGLCYVLAIFRFRLLEDVLPVGRSILFEELGEPVLILDVRGRIADCNLAARDLFSPGAAGGQESLLEVALKRCPSIAAVIDSPEVPRREVVVDRMDGRRQWQLRSFPLRREGRRLGTLVQLHDISMLMQAEEAVKAAREKAEEANLAKSRFLATVSHEMRTPLHAMAGTAELLSGMPLEHRERRAVGLFRDSCATLKTLIDDLLDLSRIEAGRLEILAAPFDLPGMLDQLRLLFADAFDRQGVGFSIVLAPDVPLRVSGDRRRLLQLLTNLVGNALKFTSSGEVVVRVGKAKGGGEHALAFSVSDTGIGIPKERQREIFGLFERIDPSVSGTGLGLTISARLAELMGGLLAVDSEPGHGSVFRFGLPLPPTEASEPAVGLPPETGAQLPAWEILAVDDVPENLALLDLYFEETPVRLTGASGASQGMAALSAGRYDCVLLDMQLPDMDGAELVRRWRRIERDRGGERTPVIGISAGAFSSDVRRALDAGCDAYLPRPVGKAELVRAIRAALRDAAAGGDDGAGAAREALVPQARGRIAECGKEVASACDAGDFVAARRAGHSAKGIGMTFGIEGAERLGDEVEAAAAAGDLDRLRLLAALLVESATG